MKRTAERFLLGFLCGLPLAQPAWAEKADRNKPVHIESDTLKVDDAQQLAIYEGNVVLTQGTLLLTSDRLDVRQDAEGFNSGEAYGHTKPVYFRQKQELRDQYVEGTGKRMEYDARNNIVKLIDKAHLKRGDEDVRGNLIIYNTETEIYRAVGTTQESGSGRVRAVIKPKQQDSNGAVKPKEVKP